MKVSAIVPVWNGRAFLEKLLDSLDRQTLPLTEILIMDNGSDDGAPEMAEQRGARVIRLGSNTGFAHAVNCGIQEAKCDYLAILNSDVELTPEWLQKLSDKSAQFATGKILSASIPEMLDGAYDLICRGGTSWRAGNGKRDQNELGLATEIESASFTAALFQKRLFDEVGLLDERFESYLEDVDFGLRCAAAGIKGTYVPEAICHHHGSAALGRWNGESVRRIARNQLFLITKHYPRSLVIRWAWRILIAHGLWGVLAARHGVGFAWLRGKWDAVLRPYAPKQPISSEKLHDILVRQEKSLYEIQIQVGMDWYWRAYFFLTAGGAK